MSRRVFILHGWDGSPNGAWLPWLKAELIARGFEVAVPAMPNPEAPTIEAWVSLVGGIVGIPDPKTYLVGHSIGCQAILRYLSSLPPTTRVGGVLLVAPWLRLQPAALPDEESKAIAQPWLDTPIDWPNVHSQVKTYTIISSSSDPYIAADDAVELQQKLSAQHVQIPGPGHLADDDHVDRLPEALNAIITMSKN